MYIFRPTDPISSRDVLTLCTLKEACCSFGLIHQQSLEAWFTGQMCEVLMHGAMLPLKCDTWCIRFLNGASTKLCTTVRVWIYGLFTRLSGTLCVTHSGGSDRDSVCCCTKCKINKEMSEKNTTQTPGLTSPCLLAANPVCSESLSYMCTDRPCRRDMWYSLTLSGVAEKVNFLSVWSNSSDLKQSAYSHTPFL